MRERAELIGGTLAISPRPQGGTRVRLQIPEAKWMPMAPKITVLLADDHALVRRGFRRMLEDDPEISVIGEASDVRKPCVWPASCGQSNRDGLRDAGTERHRSGTKNLEKFPQAGILMLSMHSEETLVSQALEAGARGYVLKMPWTSTWSAP